MISSLGIPIDAEIFEDKKEIFTLNLSAGSSGEIYFITEPNYEMNNYMFVGEQKTIKENKIIEREIYC